MSHHCTSKVASMNRIWSHNTNYTGAAGIHSEDGPVAHARNVLMDRRSSAVISAEEEILKKKMKALSVNKKCLETSMLSYSQKMKDISTRREHMFKQSTPPKSSGLPNTSKTTNNITNTPLTHDKSYGQQLHKRNLSLPFLTEDAICFTKNFQLAGKSYPASVPTEFPGRVSVDSGVGMESDSYISDNESITTSKRTSVASMHAEDSNESESQVSPGREIIRRRRGIDKRRRIWRSDNKELAPVLDVENAANADKDNESENTANVDSEESVTISPFPLEKHFTRDTDTSSSILGSISEHGALSDDLNKTRILNPLARSPVIRWKNNTTPKPKKKTPHILTKPKVVYSPSIASIKMRRAHQKSKKKSHKPHLHAFKYSDAVGTALRSLNNSPDGRGDPRIVNASPSLSSDLPGLDLNELLNEVIHRPNDCDILIEEEPEEFKPHRLFRERSFSEPLHKPMSFSSTLEQVPEDDDSELRSVLRKNTMQYPAQKKSVQFFLPDIFLHANACTSRPEEFR